MTTVDLLAWIRETIAECEWAVKAMTLHPELRSAEYLQQTQARLEFLRTCEQVLGGVETFRNN